MEIKPEGIKIQPLPSESSTNPIDYRSYLLSLGIIALITIVGYFIRDLIAPTNLVMPYLLGVISIAILYGRGPAVFASVLGVIAFDFFLVPPYLTFVVEDTEYIITFLSLFVVSVLISNLTSQIKDQMREAQDREARVESLYNLSNDLAVSYTIPSVVSAIIENLNSTLKHDVWIFLKALGENGSSDILDFEIASSPSAFKPLSEQAIRYTYESGQPSGFQTKAFTDSGTINIPLITNLGNVGVISMAAFGPEGILSAEQIQLFEAYTNLFSLALERILLSTQANQAQLLKAKEEFQSALLSSVSHDFRTPLATITGTLSSLDADINHLDQATQQLLIRNALHESEKLNRLVGNLLNISRLESGAMQLQAEPVDLQDLIGATLEQMKDRITNHPIEISIPDDIPLITGDFVLLEQALMNIMDNAVKYSPEGSPITIRVYKEHECLCLEIVDQGIGIPENEIPYIFNKFYRVKDGSRPGGTGLGLAITKGILDIHSLKIEAQTGDQGGMVFKIIFPLSVLDMTEIES